MRFPSSLLLFALSTSTVLAQESVRELTSDRPQTKFLTPNQVDRWLFEGKKGESIMCHVATAEFDSVVELARAGGKDEEDVLLAVDDEGSEARFSYRLPEDGEFEIRVHAYKFQGGGNYELQVRRFQAQPLEVGKATVDVLNAEGRSHYVFRATGDSILVPHVTGGSANWQFLDLKGRTVSPSWGGSIPIEEEGEYHLLLAGQPSTRYELVVREATRRKLAEKSEGSLEPGALEVWEFEGEPGDFRLFDVRKKGDVSTRLVFAPRSKETEQRLEAQSGPDIRFLPVASHGGHLRYAAILRNAGRYRFQVRAESSSTYELSVRDPSVPITWEKEAAGALPVGGTTFFRFDAPAGRVLQAKLATTDFVPVLRLYDADGRMVSENGTAADALESHATQMLTEGGSYRLQVSSLGDGGGGDFRLELGEIEVKALPMGERTAASLANATVDFWTFEGRGGQVVFLNARSDALRPQLRILGPSGVEVSPDVNGDGATGTLFALRLPEEGRYTVWLSSSRGTGDYTIHLIDGD